MGGYFPARRGWDSGSAPSWCAGCQTLVAAIADASLGFYVWSIAACFFLLFSFFFLIPSPHPILRFSLLCLISCWRCLTKGQPLPRQWGWGCCCCFPGALFPPARRPPRAPRPSPPCSGGTGGDPSEGAGPGCLGRDGANTKPKHQDAGLLLWWLCAKELSH